MALDLPEESWSVERLIGSFSLFLFEIGKMINEMKNETKGNLVELWLNGNEREEEIPDWDGRCRRMERCSRGSLDEMQG